MDEAVPSLGQRPWIVRTMVRWDGSAVNSKHTLSSDFTPSAAKSPSVETHGLKVWTLKNIPVQYKNQQKCP